jgi:hypothetical protein
VIGVRGALLPRQVPATNEKATAMVAFVCCIL